MGPGVCLDRIGDVESTKHVESRECDLLLNIVCEGMTPRALQ